MAIPDVNAQQDVNLANVVDDSHHLVANRQQNEIPFLSESEPCKYIKKKLIGKGAYGEAWLVQRAVDKATFVAKVIQLKDTPEKRRRYAFAEIRCLSSCDHPNVVKYIQDSGMDGDQLQIIMELADAGDLGTQLKSHKVRFSEREAGILFAQLLLALHHIHGRRMIHRDIKSGNVLLSSSGLIKLGDFGFSQQYDNTVSGDVAGTFLGTPYYLPPEMWKGQRYGKKADVWAAGIILYEILAHRRPYQAQSIQELKQVVLETPLQPVPGLSRDMDDLVKATLSHDPKQRPTTTQLLGMPIMQHYLTLFLNIVSRDTKIPADVRAAIEANIMKVEEDIKNNVDFDEDVNDPHYEGPVKKDAEGQWKDRYLILRPTDITMTLAHGKEAAPGTDRSKQIPLVHVSSVSALPNSEKAPGPLFAVQLVNGTAIVVAVDSNKTRDTWVGKIMTALSMS